MRFPPRVPPRARAFILGALLLGSTGPALARGAQAPESYHAKYWTIANGLPQGTINDLLQTSSGELWIATFAGLLRFDGFEFAVSGFDTLPDLPSARVTALAPDGGDGVWFGTQEGHVVHFDGGRIAEVERTPDTPDEILALARAGDGSLWTQASSGAVRRFGDGRWTLAIPAGRPGQYEGLCALLDGSIAVASGDELVLFEAGGDFGAALRAPAAITSLAPRSTGGPWIGLEDGLASVEEGTIERVWTTPASRARVTAITEDGAGGLWLGTPLGPWHVDLQATRTAGALVQSEGVLPQGFGVRSLLRDRDGNVWVGGSGNGLVRLRPQRIESFGLSEARGEVRGVVGDGAGGAWIATECRGLARLRAGAWEPELEPLPDLGERDLDPSRPCLWSVWRDSRGRVWIGWNDRLLRREEADDARFEPVLPNLRFPPHVGPIAETASGELWIAGGGGRLVRVSPDDRVLEERAIASEILSIAVAPDQSLWIGSRDHLLRLSGGELERFDAANGLARGDVRDIAFDPDGAVWIASYGGGLSRLLGGRAAVVSRAQGLPDASLTRLLDDGRGRLWLLSNLGLIVAERAEFAAVASGLQARIDPIVLGPEAGMPEANHGSPAGFRDELGRLWFGTIAGVVRVDVPSFPFHRAPPLVRVEHLVADERRLAGGDPVRVPAATRWLSIASTAFSLTAPERVRFRYRLEGFDPSWRAAGGERLASYTALAPGEYTFEVEARSEEGVWSEAPATLRFEVLAQWWQTLAFRIAAVLGASTLLYLAHRLRVARIERHARRLLEATEGRARAEQRESRLREELAHAGRVSTAGELATSLAHEVNQPLAAIVANAQAGRRFLALEELDRAGFDEILAEIAQQGQRASDVIRRLREFLRKRASSRRPVDASSVVRDTLPLVRRELEEHRVEVRLELQDPLPAVQVDPVELQQVIVNLVQNACEAMARQEGERRVEVRTRAVDGHVRIEVQDTGPGLDPKVAGRIFQPYVTTKDSGMGLGLAICRSIVEACGGRLSAESSPAGGVAFRIDLPQTPEVSEAR